MKSLPHILAYLLLAPLAAVSAAEFHVAPTGNDADPGTQAKPFATLERARDEIRTFKREHGLPKGGVTVWLQGGVYARNKSLALAAEDSGSADSPIVYRAVKGEPVRFVGGRVVTGWKPVTDPGVRARLDDTARGHVLEADLRAIGVSDFGEVAKPGRRAELFFNGRFMPLARYPDEGWLRIADVPQEGELKFPGDFRNGRPTVIGSRIAGKHFGRFTYDGERPARWQPSDDLWVHGYWVWDYSEQYHRVARLDAAKKEVWPQPPYHFYGYHPNARYRFLNVLEEISRPGEWHLDRRSGILYFWPPAKLIGGAVMFPVFDQPMVTLRDVSHVQFQGIVFECSRAGAVTAAGGHHVRIAGCVFRNLGATAVAFAGATDQRVESCDFYELGGGGIAMAGGDRKTLTAGRNLIENCDIHDIGRVQPTFQPAINLAGVGNRVAHCFVHDCPHQGFGYAGNDHIIEYCEFTRTGYDAGDVGAISAAMDWTYRGNVIRYCDFHDIYAPPKVHVGSMTVYLDLPVGGLHLYGNVFRDMERAFFTNSGRDCLIENNIFVRCAPSVHFNSWRNESQFKEGGSWRMVERLREVNYDRPPYSTRYPELLRLFKDGDPAIPNGNVIRRNISVGGRFLILHPLVTFNDVKVEQNLIADPIVFSGSTSGSGKASQYANGDKAIAAELAKGGNVIMEGDPGFFDAAAGDLELKATSPAWKLGFQRIPTEKIGLYRDGYRQRLPLDAPRISAAGRAFVDEGQVALLLSRRSGSATIRYTLDGSEPTIASPPYTRVLSLRATTTVRSAAFAADERSAIVSATFTVRKLGPGAGIHLADLPELDSFAHGGLKKDTNYAGSGLLKLGAHEYQKALLLCPEQTETGGRGHVTYAIDGGLRKAARFKAIVGIDDEVRKYKRGSVVFIVEVRREGAWKRVLETPVIKSGQTRAVDVDIAGCDQLRLMTTDGGDGINSDHAVWADAKLQ